MADSPDRDEQEQASAQNGAAETAADAVAPADETLEQAGEPPATDELTEPQEPVEHEEGADAEATTESNDEVASSEECALNEADAPGDEADAPSAEAAADNANLDADAGAGAVAVTEDPGGEEDLGRATADLQSIVEALIFASPEPLSPKALMKLLDSEPKEDVLAALDAVKADYEQTSGLQLVEVAGGFQIVTRSDLHEWVRRLFHERSTQKLSVQALETLAVIAYRQPITALEITEIRGVSASGVLNTLLERHLVKIVGRKQVVGRPFMYATTREFLIRFGLKDLTDLPKVEDMAESLGIESPLLVEQTPPEEQLPLSEPEPDDIGDDGGQPAAADVDQEPEDDDSGEPIN